MNATTYINKSILVALGIYDKNEELILSQQIAGIITDVDNQRITLRQLNSEQEFGLPPDLSLLERAKPGTYRLKNGNVEELENPDFIAYVDVYTEDKNRILELTTYGFVPPQ